MEASVAHPSQGNAPLALHYITLEEGRCHQKNFYWLSYIMPYQRHPLV